MYRHTSLAPWQCRVDGYHTQREPQEASLPLRGLANNALKTLARSLLREYDLCLSTRTRTRPSAHTHIHAQSTHYITSTYTLTRHNMSIHTHTRPFKPILTLSDSLCLSCPLCLAHSPHQHSHTILTLYRLHTHSHAPTHN